MAASVSAQAQNFSIDRSVIASGGGTVSGGPYTLTGTIGQIDAGQSLTGGIYELDGGFWSLNILVQTPGSPTLLISNSNGNITISWAPNVVGFRLQTSPVVGPNASWQTVSGVANNSVIEPVSIGTHYFRLIAP